MMKDTELYRHKEWLGFLQPVGLVVSPLALVNAQAFVNRDVIQLQQTLETLVNENEDNNNSLTFNTFAQEILDWQEEDLTNNTYDLVNYELKLSEFEEVLSPSYLVLDPDSNQLHSVRDKRPLLLVKELTPETPFDDLDTTTGWHASPHAKFERLLRETGVSGGILFNKKQIRLVYAPRGESSGYLTFPLSLMTEVSGRQILGAMEMLLGGDRLFNQPTGRGLIDLLHNSRKYQNEVSTKLAEQVLTALWDLLRGFQGADEATNGTLLQDLTKNDPQHIYGGLITILLRLVFLLYAEDEGLMPNDDIYTRNYSVTGLYEKLLEDSGNYPDTMDQRYGGYAWLLSLFRLVYDGGGHLPHYLPARQGQLFDPHTYPFLEGRSLNCAQTQQPEDLKDISLLGFSPDHQRAKAQQPEDLKDISLLGFSPDHQRAKAQQQGQPMIPRVSDGVIFRVLNSLLILDGERLSYRSLDVEQIGSVYEAVMGYEVECAEGLSAGIWTKPAGAKVSVTVVINVEELLATKAKDRSTFLKDYSCELAGKSLTALQQAKTPDEVLSALGRKLSPQTPTLLPVGSLYLQPTEERRRTASHYTPRSMTEPIVKETLRPILKLLGDRPTPEQLLNLKICDLAMGSGAFLVETCRQLAEELVKAWEREETPLLRFSAEDKLLRI
jgi:hypothetical protein